jgi:hypothetical protein
MASRIATNVLVYIVLTSWFLFLYLFCIQTTEVSVCVFLPSKDQTQKPSSHTNRFGRKVFIIQYVDIVNLKTHQKTFFHLLTKVYNYIDHDTHKNFITSIDTLFFYFSITTFKTVPQIGIHLVGMVLSSQMSI